MKHKILYLLTAGLLLTGCNDTTEEQQSRSISNIVTTTGMIRDAVANIVKDSVQVEALMGPGVDPHVYKATQGDLKKLTSADLVFYNGLHLEGKMGSILEKFSRQKPVYPVAEDIDSSRLLSAEAYQGTHDPHIWFDVSLWQEAVQQASDKLIKHDSVHGGYYRENTQNYLSSLDTLHRWVHKRLQSIPQTKRVLITAHDAFRYFGEAYNIKVVGLQGLSTVSEFGLKDVSNLVSFIVKREIKAVFVESSVPERYIKSVVEGCRQRGHQVKIGGTLYSDAMGEPGTPEGTYIGMVRHNVNTIVKALK